MDRKIVLLISIVSLIFTGCGNEEKTEYYKDGKIKAVYEYKLVDNKVVLDGKGKYYNDRGEIVRDLILSDGKVKSGIIHEFNDNYKKIVDRGTLFRTDNNNGREKITFLPKLLVKVEMKEGKEYNGYSFMIDTNQRFLSKRTYNFEGIKEYTNGKETHCSPFIDIKSCKYDFKEFVLRNDIYSIQNLSTDNEELQILAINTDSRLFDNIKNPSEKVQLAAIKKDAGLFQKIKNPSEKVQMIAIGENASLIEHLKNPSEKVQLLAVKQNGYSIKHINNPSENVQLTAVKQDGHSIKHINNPSEEIQLESINKDYGQAFKYIKNPSERVQLAAVSIHEGNLQYISNPSDKVITSTGKEKVELLKYLDNVNLNEFDLEKVVEFAPNLLKKIKNPSEKVQMIAIGKNASLIEHLKNPSEKVQIKAVQRDSSLLKYLKNPSDAIYKAIISKNWEFIKEIKNPSNELVIRAALASKSRGVNNFYKAIPSVKRIFEVEDIFNIFENESYYKKIKEPTINHKLALLRVSNGIVAEYIRNPSKEFITESISLSFERHLLQYFNISEELVLSIIKENPRYIRYLKKATEAVQLAAVKEDILSFFSIKTPSVKTIEYIKNQRFTTRDIEKNSMYIRFLENPTEEQQFIAYFGKKNLTEKEKKEFRYFNPKLFKYIKNPSEKIQIHFVQNNQDNIKYLKNPSEKVQLAAVKKDSFSLFHIKNPSERILLEYITLPKTTLQNIKNPSEKVQLAAVKKDIINFLYIKHPTKNVINYVEKQNKNGNNLPKYMKEIFSSTFFASLQNPSKEIQLEAVKKNGNSIKYVNNPSEDVQLLAVKEDGYAIEYIKNPSEKVQLEAIKKNSGAFKYIKNPSKKVQLEAIKESPTNIKYIKNPNEELQLLAVNKRNVKFEFIQNPTEKTQTSAVRYKSSNISFIKNPSEILQFLAVKSNLLNISEIKNPSEKVQLYVVGKRPYLIREIDNPVENLLERALNTYKREPLIFKTEHKSQNVIKDNIEEQPILGKENKVKNVSKDQILKVKTLKTLKSKKNFDSVYRDVRSKSSLFKDAEKRLNKRYKLVKNKLDTNGKKQLLKEQRAWMKMRNKNAIRSAQYDWITFEKNIVSDVNNRIDELSKY